MVLPADGGAAIRERQGKKEYDAITTGSELAETLTKHLREVCKDKHLRVRYSPEALPTDTGRRRGKSPYQLLGLPLPTTVWWALLKWPPEQLRQQLSAPDLAA